MVHGVVRDQVDVAGPGGAGDLEDEEPDRPATQHQHLRPEPRRGLVDRPHRHVSAAINYYFQGRGYSTVEGKRYEWEAGDLMLSAPGWAVHNHASKDKDVYELTIQDQPMHLALGSLLWHEDLRGEPKLLGLSSGFSTNRAVKIGSGK